ncbi:MAG: hypothetical protein AAGM38_19260 [Pseudomonadota bacterium]
MRLLLGDPALRWAAFGVAAVLAVYAALASYTGARVEAELAKRERAAATELRAIEEADDALIGTFSGGDADRWLCERAGRSDCGALGGGASGPVVAGAPR